MLERVDDPRLRVLRNEQRRGLAASLNRGLDAARGRVRRTPRRRRRRDAATGSSDSSRRFAPEPTRRDPRLRGAWSSTRQGESERSTSCPTGAGGVRWAALFSSPFLHPTVIVERDVLDRHGLRYDEGYAESEDYELWSRLLDVADGDNVRAPLVLYRVHPRQASQRRRELQRECQLRVARRLIADVAPTLSSDEVELAWRVGVAASRSEPR